MNFDKGFAICGSGGRTSGTRVIQDGGQGLAHDKTVIQRLLNLHLHFV